MRSYCSSLLLGVTFLASSSLLLLLSSSGVAATKCTFVSQRIQCGPLTCDVETGECIPCTNTSQCHEAALDCMWNGAKHRDECLLMSVEQLADQNLGGLIGSAFVAIFTCAIAVLGGAGGGAILVGLYQVLLGVPLVNAVALSQATIVGQSFFNVLIQVGRYHPHFQPPGPTRPAINFVLLFFWLPISLVGCMWGNLAGKVVPDWFRLALMFVLLSYILQRMVKKVIAQRKLDKEKAEGKSAVALLGDKNNDDNNNNYGTAAVGVAGDISDDEDDDNKNNNRNGSTNASSAYIDSSRFLAGGNGVSDNNINRSSHHHAISEGDLSSQNQALVDNTDDDNHEKGNAGAPKRRKISSKIEDHDDYYPQHPIRLYILILVVVVPLVVANIAKNLWVKCSDNITGYWLLDAAVTVYCIIIFLFYRHHLVNTREAIARGDEKPNAIPFVWNTKTSIIFPILSLTAGASASLFGLGGGLILSFLFLEAGLLPEEVSATSGFTTFIIALESLIQFVIQGNVRYDYCLLFMGCGVVSTALGQKVIMPEIKRRGWTFLIVASLTFIMGGSMVVLAAVGIYDTIDLVNHGGSIGFGQLCPSVDVASSRPDTVYDALDQFSKFVF